jgi:hypothetical protein
MPIRILHVIDSSTSPDAVEVLALLLDPARAGLAATHAHTSSAPRQEIIALGHRSTATLLESAGISTASRVANGHRYPALTWLPSMGWADPTPWRKLRARINSGEPTLLHAWGLTAAVACAMAGRAAARIITLTDLPAALTSKAGRLLSLIDRGTWRRNIDRATGRPAQWVGFHQYVAEGLIARGIEAARVRWIPLAIGEGQRAATGSDAGAVREELGLLPQDGPVFVLAGDASRHARHDYGLWAGGIVQQMFPRVRVVVREDLRHRRNFGLERLIDHLADPGLVVLAPGEMGWDALMTVADAVLVPADGPVPMGAALHAMAAGVPVVGTPVEVVRELIDDRRTGLVAASLKPRALAARIEELLNDRALRDSLVAAAREGIRTHRSPAAMVEAFGILYAQESVPGAVAASV